MAPDGLDVRRARAETPGCAHVVHLNNAGASLPPQPVLDVVVETLREEAAVGGYELADCHEADLEAVYASTARLVGADADEIALTDSATRAWNTALGSVPLGEGDRVLISRAEYGSSMLALLQLAHRSGVRVELVPDDEHGQVDVDALAAMLDERVRLVAVTHVPTNSGLVNPVAAVGAAVRGTNAVYLVDACQSVGQLPVDVGTIGCDLLSVTGRKFLRAPRGTGFLYARRETTAALEPGPIDNRAADWVAVDRYQVRADARRFETWERNVALMLGFGAAVEYALGWGIEPVATRVTALAEGLRLGLATVDGVVVRDPGAQRCGIVTFTMDGVDVEAAVPVLRDQGINVWHSGVDAARIDFEARGLDAVMRASPHYYNTEEELDRLVDAVGSLR